MPIQIERRRGNSEGRRKKQYNTGEVALNGPIRESRSSNSTKFLSHQFVAGTNRSQTRQSLEGLELSLQEQRGKSPTSVVEMGEILSILDLLIWSLSIRGTMGSDEQTAGQWIPRFWRVGTSHVFAGYLLTSPERKSRDNLTGRRAGRHEIDYQTLKYNPEYMLAVIPSDNCPAPQIA